MPDGSPYAASDPHLLAWVHVAEVDSFLRAYQRLRRARRSTRPAATEYVAQIGEVARRSPDPARATTGRRLRSVITNR